MIDNRAETSCPDLPDSWYPVCRSFEVRRNRPFAVRALGLEWVVFRADDGTCATVQRYCCHMGTDLALGRVIDSNLHCPLHHWRFDGTGRCVGIPASARIPVEAKLASLRCVERFGIVFVGHGPGSLFDFPAFPDGRDTAHSRPKVVPMPAPYHTVSLNLFDVQHLSTIHGRKLHQPAEIFSVGPNHLGIRYSAYNLEERLGNRLARWTGLSANHIRVDCWGGNLLFISIEGRRPNFIMALMPDDAGSCRLYLATVESSSAGPLGQLARRITLELAASLTRAFISEDIRTLSNARTSAGVLLPDADAEAIRFWTYFGDLPKSAYRAVA